MLLSTVVRPSSPLVRYVAMAVDVFIIWGCGFAAFLGLQGGSGRADMPVGYELVMFATSLMMISFSREIYRSWLVNDLGLMLRSVGGSWVISVTIMVIWLFFTRSSDLVLREWLLGWALGTLTVLCLQRLAVYAGLRWLRRRGYSYKTVLLVGAGPVSRQVRQALAQSAWGGLQVAAELSPEQVGSFIDGQTQRQPDEVWLCLPMDDKAGIRTVLEALRHSTANIRMVPDMGALKLINPGISQVMGMPMLDLSVSPITGRTLLLKAVQDYALGLIILLLISPLLLGIALAVKFTSPGPVLYKQRRHGWNGKEIWVYKFRSMVVHEELHGQVTQARKNDARVTPLGAFLRRTSLDELPQFINVLQGRMSIVGPRPHALTHNEHYKDLVPRYMLRHKVRPGITGWAQINGFRGETDTLDKMEKRVQCDLDYIENISLGLDLKIILTTVFKGFVHRHAY